ncbi:MAG: hypothetical protein HY317_04420 [Acidobacteria bacterium]|nr:hypothetical protein [Acidobacteriota bacterium]
MLGCGGCTPDWATQNSTPFVMEVAGITGGDGDVPILSDVLTDGAVVNDEARVTVNIFRKNNNGDLATSPAEHIYMKRYEVRYFRTDGRNVEGIDVPHRISGPLGNVRFHTPGPGGDGEVEAEMIITIVRHQAKLEPPLNNLQGVVVDSLGGSALVLTTIAEITIHAQTVQGENLQASGQAQVTFANFPD